MNAQSQGSLDWISTAPTPTAPSSRALKHSRLAGREKRRHFARPWGREPGPASRTVRRTRLDLFLPEAAPHGLLVFVHGGYWLGFDREMWSHLASGAVARGWACAIPSYTLAPEARIAAMTQEIARAVEVAGESGRRSGRRYRPLRGRSFERPDGVRRCIPVNPRQAGRAYLSACRSRANLSDGDEHRLAPQFGGNRGKFRQISLRPAVQSHIWVGAQERPAFLWQAQLLSEAWSCPWTPESGRHHFDVIDGLTDPTSALLSVCLD